MIVVDMTPALAQHLLDTVDVQTYRAMSLIYVERFIREMRRGRWQVLATAPVSIDIYGRLRDGRMRLHAVTVLGRTVTMAVELVKTDF